MDLQGFQSLFPLFQIKSGRPNGWLLFLSVLHQTVSVERYLNQDMSSKLA
jgi:hypothetical protein